MFDGLLFGFIDNGVLAICALLGIDLDKKFAGQGINGALYGCVIWKRFIRWNRGNFGLRMVDYF